GEVAELALDIGVIRAGGREEPFHEIEIELKAKGIEADLAALSERVAAALPVEPEARSKSGRGASLLEQHTAADADAQRPEERPTELPAVPVSRRPLVQVAQESILRNLERLDKATEV